MSTKTYPDSPYNRGALPAQIYISTRFNAGSDEIQISYNSIPFPLRISFQNNDDEAGKQWLFIESLDKSKPINAGRLRLLTRAGSMNLVPVFYVIEEVLSPAPNPFGVWVGVYDTTGNALSFDLNTWQEFHLIYNNDTEDSLS